MRNIEVAERVFEVRADRAARGYGYLAAGAALVVAGGVGFWVSLHGQVNSLNFHFMTTVPMILAVGMFTAGIMALRTFTRVTVGERELVVFRREREAGRWLWCAVALAKTATGGMSQHKVLKIYGENGKHLVTLSDYLEDFDAMVDEIQARMEQTPCRQRVAVATSKARRNGLLLMVFGCLFFALAFFNAWNAIHEREERELLATKAVSAQGKVVRKFTAPDGKTRRIEYRVDVPGAEVKNVQVDPSLWFELREGQQFAVEAVPGRPEFSRLKQGQIRDSMDANPSVMLLLSVVIGIMSIVFFVAGVLSWRGIEVKWDSEKGRIKVGPVGEA